MIDVRPTQAYNTAHIKGAINIPVSNLYNENGTMKDDEGIKKILSEKGVDINKPIMIHC